MRSRKVRLLEISQKEVTVFTAVKQKYLKEKSGMAADKRETNNNKKNIKISVTTHWLAESSFQSFSSHNAGKFCQTRLTYCLPQC